MCFDAFFFQHCSYNYRKGDRADINNGEWEAERISDKGMLCLVDKIKHEIYLLCGLKHLGIQD
jgi:hypothetical protein